MLLLYRAQVQSLVREQRSYTLLGKAKKKKKSGKQDTLKSENLPQAT